ncbi:MAG: hypothetical protein ACR2MA_12545 [Egibacteraceae bacterium]
MESRSARRWLAVALSLLGLGLVAARVALVVATGTVNFAGQTVGSEILGSFWPLGALAVGGLITVRRPELRMGWWWLAIGLSAATMIFGQLYARYSLVLAPGKVPGGVTAHQLAELSFLTLFASLVFAILLFPDGHLPARGWRWLGWLLGGCWILGLPLFFVPGGSGMVEGLGRPWGVKGFAWYGTVFAQLVLVFCLVAVLTLAAQVGRYRRSGGRERAQLKWLTFGGVMVLLGFALEYPLVLLGIRVEGMVDVVYEATVFNAPPVAVGIAVLRNRLYDIDRIISRTLAWTVLTLLLVGAYVSLVVVLQQVLAPVTGQSELAVAGATLAAAALFTPLRKRVQSGVDRRFNRERYNHERIVAAFRTRLRSEVDLQALSADLVATVGATVQPAHVSLWTPAAGGREPRAASPTAEKPRP